MLAARLSLRDHRLLWHAENAQLGGTTPYEALMAGRREAVLELDMGRPGADPSRTLVSAEEGAAIRRSHGDLTPPYEP